MNKNQHVQSFAQKLKNFESGLISVALAIYLPIVLFFMQGLSVSLALLFLAGLLSLYRTKRFVKPWLFLFLAAFPILGIGAVLGGFAPENTLFPAVKFFLLILVGYVVFLNAKNSTLPIKPLLFGVALSLAIGWLNIVSNFSLMKLGDFTFRTDSIKGMSLFSLFLTISLWPLIYYSVQTKETRLKIGLFVLISIAVVSIFSLVNHTAQYCLVLGGIAWILTFVVRRHLIKVIFSLSVLTTVMSMPWFVKDVLNVDRTVQSLPIHKGSFYHRLAIWQFVVDQVTQEPLNIGGFDAMRAQELEAKAAEWDQEKFSMFIFQNFQDTSSFDPPRHPHNAALQAWQEFGVAGALLLSLFLIYGIYLIDTLPSTLGRATGYSLFVTGATLFHTSYGLWESKWWMLFVITFGILYTLERNRASARN